jgi:seryl-tRNA(Sec) selenium transferase
MLNQSAEQLQRRATDLQQRLSALLASQAEVSVQPDTSEIGGGTLAVRPIPTVGVRVRPHDGSAADWESRLRGHQTPILVRVQRGALYMDVRTLQAQDSQRIEEAVRKVIAIHE